MMKPTRSILIVDDEPVMVKSLADFLNGRGFDATTFTDSVRARATLTTTSFDIILLDLNMPNVDGVELASIARAKNLNTRIIFITGLFPGTELADRLSGITGAVVLIKPFELTDLMRLLNVDAPGETEK